MTDKEILQIDEKYTVVLDQDVTFKFYATRNGESWRDLTGDNLVLAMFQQLLQLKQENREMNKQLQAYKKDRFCKGGCAIYQYDKIQDLQQKLDKAVEGLRGIANELEEDYTILDFPRVCNIAKQLLQQLEGE